jgi:IS1 family transposase/lambda repressor-like predicted transcriptional regulator
MNRLSTERRGQIVGLLVEGMSMRAISRTTGVARNTVDKLLVDLGVGCAEYQDGALTNLTPKRVEADEIWSFCYSKAKNVPEQHQGTFGYGDVWTWTAIDADSKLVPSWLVGERTAEDCYAFLRDLKLRCVPGHRFQLTTDGLGSYPVVVDSLWRDGIDFAQLVKEYDSPTPTEARKYSPAKNCRITDIKVMNGEPDPDHISTSYVERQNLTMRMGMRRFTRLTNGFSKKIENHAASVSLHFMHYNLGRVHQSLAVKREGRSALQRTPAMAAGVAEYPWSVGQIAALLD